MFFKKQSTKQKKEYQDFLKIVWCLSNLYGDSNIPYLYYRVAENIFCRAFEAENLSRSDLSVDAKKWTLWIWLKTFVANNNKTFQKVAEFNKDKPLYESLSTDKMLKKISELRNTRIEFTQNVYGLNKSIYHCVIRKTWKFLIYEEPMEKINIDKIKNIKKNKWSIGFSDGKNDYSFLVSKSTLTKRFLTDPVIFDFPVNILKDPLIELSKLLSKKWLSFGVKSRIKDTVYLPLYSDGNVVYTKSSLNQWNGWWRPRDLSEVYIQIPAPIHRVFPKFFPDRNTPFNLRLPNWKIMRSKVCQAGGKALMSYSNRELWQRILRDVLKLKEGKILTYNKLQELWIDSVRIDKIDNENFEINFSAIWSYETFKNNFLWE
jgi:hypothetical protein